MKSVVLLLTVFIGVFLVNGSEKYTDAYDNINVEAILKSSRLTKQYLECLLQIGPCTSDGRALKRNLPDAIATNCEKCTKKQRDLAQELVALFKEIHPDLIERLGELYNLNPKQMVAFEESLKDEEQ